MTEDEYIKVTDLAKMRAAAAVLRDVIGVSADAARKALSTDIVRLESAVEKIELDESP